MASIQFSDTVNKSGIIQLTEFNCGLGDGAISGNTTLLKQITAQTNIAMSEIWHTLWSYQPGWQYDDANQTDLPQGVFTLVDDQRRYALPAEALTINRIEIKDKEGDFYQLTPLTEKEIFLGIDRFMETKGLPQYYRVIGRTFEVFPAPSSTDTTLVGGGKVYFDRAGISFESTDTTAVPGFSSEYQDLVPIKTSIKWLQVHKPDSPTLVSLQNTEIRRMAELREFESGKFKDRSPLVMRGASNNPR